MKWDKEEIEAASDKINYRYIHTLIAELEKPKPVFKEGEVLFCQLLEDDQPTGRYGIVEYETEDLSSCRHLTPSEVPALALAIERLEKIDGHTTDGWVQTIVRQSLSDIKTLL